MEPFKWADLIAIANAVVAVVAVFIAFLSPKISWGLARRSQKEDQGRRERLGVFSTLMQSRAVPQSREAVGALNLIDVAFEDCPTVRRIWREYFGMICNSTFTQSPVGRELTKQKLADLQAEMARVLNFSSIDRFDVERAYVPTWLKEEEDIKQLERMARFAALRYQPPQQTPVVSPQTEESAPQSAVYLLNYTGVEGAQGYGVLFIGGGAIHGSDIAGGRYEGTYQVEANHLRGVTNLYVQAGSVLVTGAKIDQPTTIPVAVDFPVPISDGKIYTVDVAGVPVNVSLKKIRDVP